MRCFVVSWMLLERCGVVYEAMMVPGGKRAPRNHFTRYANVQLGQQPISSNSCDVFNAAGGPPDIS